MSPEKTDKYLLMENKFFKINNKKLETKGK